MSGDLGFSCLSRRRWLKLTLGLGGAIVVGGGGLWGLRGSADAVDGLATLNAHEYRTLSKLALALFPAGGAFASGARDLDLARSFDRFLADEPPWNRDDLKRALLLLEYGPVVFERRMTTFSNLSDAERLTHFEAWMLSDSLVRRQVSMAFRKFLSLVFYDRPEVWPHIGYVGPQVGSQ